MRLAIHGHLAILPNVMNAMNRHKYETRATIIKALAHPTRLWIAEELSQGERCVCEFADKIDADFSTISKHLTILKQAGIVEDDKRGKQVFYTLKVPCIMNFMGCVEAVIESQLKSHKEALA